MLIACCRITVLTPGFTFNFFLLFTFMKHLQTYIRSDTSWLPVRRWKKFRPKGSINRRYLGRFSFSSFFLSNVKSSPRASQDQQKVWFCHHTMQYLGKALPSFLQTLLCNMGWGATLPKNPKHNSLVSHQAELFILTFRDDSPIPFPFLSWYSIFNLHRWQLLPCLRIPRKHWHNLSL